ncbi:MAG: hypothetical protein HQM11_21155 [SAR324 cluster bacterium]|nr:hypothetical protein [SAR324 cluster bacterium]
MEQQPSFLEQIRTELNEIAKPYQQQQNQRKRRLDVIAQCIRCTEKDDFLTLDTLLKSNEVADVEQESELADCQPLFEQLREYASQQVDRYRVDFLDDLKNAADAVGLPITIDLPRFTIMKGIEGSVDFSGRLTLINDRPIKTIDPKRIISAALKLKRRLYDRPFDPQNFINSIFKTYTDLLKLENKPIGQTVPIQPFYKEYVMSLQSKVFFLDMDKVKFKGYSLDEFAVDFWRYMESNSGPVSGKYMLELRPGRNSNLWMIDPDGQRRQISGIAFQENQ